MSESYDFQNLSFDDFERLTRDLLSVEWGVPFEIFKTGRDKGIDLRFTYPKDNKKIIVQCKRYATNSYAALLNKLKNEELPKVKNLNPDRYVIVTSVLLSVAQKDEIYSLLKPFCKTSSDIFGASEVNALIKSHPEVERTHFKLWLGSTSVLESILHSGIWNRTFVTIQEIQNEISKFVIHDGLNQAVKILEEKKHCIIVGIPGIGKTTLAKILLYKYIEIDYEAVVISSDVNEAWNVATDAIKNDKKLVILYDDFLGQISFDHRKFEKNEEHRFLQLLKLVRKSKNIRFILTTREYILADAKRHHAALARDDIYIEKFTLSIDNYNLSNRARILFNHILFSDLPESRIEAIVKSKVYSKIINHRNFNPRIVSSITENVRYKNLTDKEYIFQIGQEFANPEQVWDHAFKNDINPHSRLVLFLLWSFNEFATLEAIQESFFYFIKDKSESEKRELLLNSLKELDGNFIKSEKIKDFNNINQTVIRFHNPSIRDYINRQINSNILIEISEACSRFKQVFQLFDELAFIEDAKKELFLKNLFKEASRLISKIEEQPITNLAEVVLRNSFENLKVKRLNLLLDLGEKISENLNAYNVSYPFFSNENEWLKILKHAQSDDVKTFLIKIKKINQSNLDSFVNVICDFENASYKYIDNAYSIIDVEKIINIFNTSEIHFNKLSKESLANNIKLLVQMSLENINEMSVSEIEEEIVALSNSNKILSNALDQEINELRAALSEKEQEEEHYESENVEKNLQPNMEIIEIDELFAELINH